MTIKMKRYIIFAALATLGLSSCDSALERTPQSQLSPESYFRTETDLQLFSNTFYNNLLDKDMFAHQSDQYTQLVMSNEMRGGTTRTVPKSGGGWSWGDLRKLNTMLEYINNCSDEAAVKKYTGVCQFFRAYIYYDKVRRFGDVPWIDKQLGSADAELYNPRDSREYVMTKMLEDIDSAIEKLPSEVSVYRVNKWTALALKSSFCLFEGTYRKYHELNLEGHDYQYYLNLAAEAAKEIIDGGKYKLYSTGKPNEDYMTLFAEENADKGEYILAINFDFGLEIFNNSTAFAILQTQGRTGVTKKIVDSYLMKDGSRFTDKPGWQTMQFKEEVADRDPRLAQSIRTPGYHRIGQTQVLAPDFAASVTGFQTVKFVMNPSAGNNGVDRPDRSINDLPVIRYAEILLNYAEAKAELGTLTQEDLNISVNKIRERAGMPNLNMAEANANPDWYLASKEYGYMNVDKGANKGVILEIRRERTIELAQEGYTRWFDLMRWKEGNCVDQEVYGMYFPGPGEYDLTGDGKTDIVLYTDTKPEGSVTAYKIGTDIYLSNGESGYVNPHRDTERTKFNEVRDYLYPIPINDRSLNPNLAQNPGWDDGLDF